MFSHLLLLFLLSYAVNTAHSQVLVGNEDGGSCAGSLTFYQGLQEKYSYKWETSLEIKPTEIPRGNSQVDRVVMSGCRRCFLLYKKKEGTGPSHTLNQLGEHEITLGRVRRLESFSCTKTAMPVWGVAGTVLGVVIIIGMVTVVGLKIYRKKKYAGVNSEEDKSVSA